LHRVAKLIERHRGIGEGTTSEIAHEGLHGGPLIAKKVVELGQNQRRNVACPRPVDGLLKQDVVRSRLDGIGEKRAGVADEGRRASDDHRTARPRRPARGAPEWSPRSWVAGAGYTARAPGTIAAG